MLSYASLQDVNYCMEVTALIQQVKHHSAKLYKQKTS